MSDSNVTDALVLHHLQKIMKEERKKDEAVNALRSARKAAKADGVSLKTLDSVRHLMKLDQGELADDFNEFVRYARLLEVPVYSQLSLFEVGEPSMEDTCARAKADGLRAGKLGHDQSTCPHDPTAPAGQAWLDGYHDGQAILLSAIKHIPEPPAAEPPKGRRSRKTDIDANMPM
jgi:ribosome modulation factor